MTSTTSFSRSPKAQLARLFAIAIAFVAALVTLLHYMAGSTSSDQGPIKAVDSENNSISILLSSEPPQMDSSRATDQVSGMVLGHVMEGLLRMNQQDQLTAAIAERWEVTNTQATFWLRKDAKWSDGRPIIAADFIFSWTLALKPETGSQYAFLLHSVKNGLAINEGKLPPKALGVSAPDDHTLIVELERPTPFFDKMMVFPVFLPIREDFFLSTNGRYGADAEEMLYSGPFMLTQWVHSSSMVLQRNPYYWNTADIKLDRINVPYITSDITAALNFFKDEKIASTGLAAENLAEAMRLNWPIRQHQDGSVFYLEFNHRDGRLTDNLKLRQAIQLSLDMEELVYKVTKLPGYLPGVSLLPGWLMGERKLLREEYPPKPVVPNKAKAKKLLAQALEELGLEELPVMVLLSGDNPLSSLQAEWMQQELRQNLGLRLKIDKQIFKQRLAKMTSGEFDMVLAGWGPDYNDPLTFADLFASWNMNNRGRYASQAMDALVAQAQNSIDPAVRMRAFGDIQELLIDDVVVLPMYERGVNYVVHPRLKGIKRRVIGPSTDLTRAYIAAEDS